MMHCIHHQIDVSSEWQDDMHCEGWQCRTCDAYIYGECHHRSWCREDFCGVGPALWVHEPEPVLPTRWR